MFHVFSTRSFFVHVPAVLVVYVELGSSRRPDYYGLLAATPLQPLLYFSV